jgi:hypothetical protein
MRGLNGYHGIHLWSFLEPHHKLTRHSQRIDSSTVPSVMGALLAGFFWFNSFGIKDQDEDLQRIARLKSHAATTAFVAAVAGTVAWVL